MPFRLRAVLLVRNGDRFYYFLFRIGLRIGIWIGIGFGSGSGSGIGSGSGSGSGDWIGIRVRIGDGSSCNGEHTKVRRHDVVCSSCVIPGNSVGIGRAAYLGLGTGSGQCHTLASDKTIYAHCSFGQCCPVIDLGTGARRNRHLTLLYLKRTVLGMYRELISDIIAISVLNNRCAYYVGKCCGVNLEGSLVSSPLTVKILPSTVKVRVSKPTALLAVPS